MWTQTHVTGRKYEDTKKKTAIYKPGRQAWNKSLLSWPLKGTNSTNRTGHLGLGL